jgi:gas vesicle protein
MEGDTRFNYFFLGLGLGAVAGLLLAPRRGAESRDYMRLKTQEGADYLKNQGQQLVDSVTETIERGKQAVQDQVKNLSDAVDAGKQAYRDAVEPTPSKPNSL